MRHPDGCTSPSCIGVWLSRVRTCTRPGYFRSFQEAPRRVLGAMSRCLGRPATPLHRLREQVVLAVWMKRGADYPHLTALVHSLMMRKNGRLKATGGQTPCERFSPLQ